jgi:large subunit ribosomal protein L25
MAGEIPDLIAEARAGTGKGAARQARREGKVPGIVYGGGADPQPIQIPFNQLLKRLKDGRFLSTLFNLKVEGQEDVRVICRGVQRDVVKDLPTHVDLMRLRRTSKVNLFIPVEFVNQEEAPGPEAWRRPDRRAPRGRADRRRRATSPITSPRTCRAGTSAM